MSFRRVFQIVTIAFALAFTFTATSSTTAYACDPGVPTGGYC
jgi:hypothetical protein